MCELADGCKNLPLAGITEDILTLESVAESGMSVIFLPPPWYGEGRGLPFLGYG